MEYLLRKSTEYERVLNLSPMKRRGKTTVENHRERTEVFNLCNYTEFFLNGLLTTRHKIRSPTFDLPIERSNWESSPEHRCHYLTMSTALAQQQTTKRLSYRGKYTHPFSIRVIVASNTEPSLYSNQNPPNSDSISRIKSCKRQTQTRHRVSRYPSKH